tara:strand:- start:340 stop:480 length:141 start_codon:yes stop_codon:yes gene_type:complete
MPAPTHICIIPWQGNHKKDSLLKKIMLKIYKLRMTKESDEAMYNES